MINHSSFFWKNSFIIKFHKEKIERGLFPKILFFSFCLKRKKILQKIRIFLQIQGRKNGVYIEDPSKEINQVFFEKFGISNISIEVNQFKKKLGKIFHEKPPFPILDFKEKIFFKKKKKVSGLIEGYDNDFVKVRLLEQNRNFNNEKETPNPEACFKFSEKTEGNLQKIKTNHLFIPRHLVQRNLGESLPMDQETPGIKYTGLENFLKIQDIVQLKNETFSKIITGLSKKEVKLLSLNGCRQSLTWKKMEKRFLTKKFLSSQGYDKNGNMILEGDYCKIFLGSNKDEYCKILFIQNDFLFLNKPHVSRKPIHNLLAASCNEIELVNKKKVQFENFFEIPPPNVKISKGVLKGYDGNIVQIEKGIVELDVLSIGKTIKIPLGNINWEKTN